MAERELKVVIRAKDLYTKILNKSQRATLGFSKAVNTLKRNWILASVAIVAAIASIRKAWNLAFKAAQFQQQEQAFANLAASHGANADKIIDNLRRVSAATISTADLMESAGTAFLLGIPADNLEKMMEIARASSRITGQTIQAAFNDISKGMGRQSKLILDNLGIMIRVEEANKAYALAMGITGRALTDAEKKQAFFNATMEAGEDTIKRVGELQLTSAEAMQAFTATVQNAGIFIGKALIYITTAVAGVTQLAASTVARALEMASDAIATILDKLSVLPLVGKRFAAASESMREFAEFERAVQQEALGNADALFEVTEAIFRQTEAVQGLVVAKKTQATAETALKIAQGPGVIGAVAGEQLMQDTLGPTLFGMNTRLEEMALFHEQKIAQMREEGKTAGDIAAQQAQQEISTIRQTEQMKQQLRQNGFGMATGVMRNMFVATGSHSKAMFALMKAFAIAQALIDAKAAVVGSYKIGASIGGPILGAAFAAAAAAATAAQIRGIISQKIDGGSTPSIGGSTPVAHGGAQPIPTREIAQAQQAQNVVINIYNPLADENWAEMAENNIIPAINAASERNVHVEVRTVAA